MSVQAIITLQTLRCIAESDRGGTSHSEPYVWPFLASVAQSPGDFETTPTAAIQADSRKIIRNEMRAGQSATLEGPANRLVATFADDQTQRSLLLIVGLLEADDAPVGAMQAGYQAYLDELRLQIGHNILTLKTATPQERAQIIAQISATVSAKVMAAIRAHLTAFEKFKFFIGALNPDDFMGMANKDFADLAPGIPPVPFTLRFGGVSGDPRVDWQFGRVPPFKQVEFPVQYELDGDLIVEHVAVDPCQARIDGVAAAEALIASLHHQVTGLQGQLSHATPQQKPGIIAMIRKINSENIPEAEAALGKARRALDNCRTHAPVGGSAVQPVFA